jgi:hypothetical protein
LISSLIRYFDLNATMTRSGAKGSNRRTAPVARAWAFPQWLVLFAGVLIQPFLDGYKQTHHWQWNGFLGWVLFAIITAFIVFPAVYRNSFDRDKPIAVLLAPIFTAGIGWQSIVTTVLEATTQKLR